MNVLFTMDKKDYADDMPVCERYGVRAIIKNGNSFAMQKSNAGEYKIPGGGVEQGESFVQALLREVREETGLLVNPDTITELGEVLEIKKDEFSENQKYIAHSLYYICEVLSDTVETAMTESELEHGFHLEWARLEDIIANNLTMQHENWIERDTRFLQLILDGKVNV